MLRFPIPAVGGAALAFVVAWAATLGVRWVAPRWGLVAQPRRDRWHRRPTPLLGGVGIYAGLIVAWAVLRPQAAHGTLVLAAATGLFVTGLVDDIWNLRPNIKLSLQLLAAAGVVAAGLVLPWTPFRLTDDLFTIFWLVGVTNAVNLLDNMDGLAAGVVMLGGAFQVLFFLQNQQPGPAIIAALLVGAVAAFFTFNFSPASIFMGDCGSLLLGFLLASLPLFSNWQRSRGLIAVLSVPVLIMTVPILDTTLVTFSRLGHGRSVSQGGRDHSSHRLVALGLSEGRAVLILMGLAAAGGGFAVLLQYLHAEVLYILIPCFALGVMLFAVRLGMVRVYEDSQPVLPSVAILVDFTYRLRVLEVGLDLFLMAGAYFGAFLLRFGGQVPADQIVLFNRFAPLVLVLEAVVFLTGGMYRNLWRYFGIEDLLTITKSTVMAAAVAATAILLAQFQPRLSLSVLILNGMLLLLLICASRAALRALSIWLERQAERPAATPVLIYGAGDAGAALARRLRQDSLYRPVGFLDDDKHKVGRRLHGIRIYGRDQLGQVVSSGGVRKIFISSASIPDGQVHFADLPVQRFVPPPLVETPGHADSAARAVGQG